MYSNKLLHDIRSASSALFFCARAYLEALGLRFTRRMHLHGSNFRASAWINISPLSSTVSFFHHFSNKQTERQRQEQDLITVLYQSDIKALSFMWAEGHFHARTQMCKFPINHSGTFASHASREGKPPSGETSSLSFRNTFSLLWLSPPPPRRLPFLSSTFISLVSLERQRLQRRNDEACVSEASFRRCVACI